MSTRLCLLAVLLLLSRPALAQQPQSTPPEEALPEGYIYEEQVVVSASKTEQALVNAPATISVISGQAIRQSPAAHIGDLLRTVPGVNVTQTSARDINIVSRGASSTLATSQLALVDGRSIYLDFFGMVMWDLVPSSLREIKQIEVIRGPASAVWGANAMTGVVNVITRSPREMAADGASSVTLGVGAFGRRVGSGVGQGTGTLFSLEGTHAQVVNDRVAFKVSGGFLTQDALPRPVGTIANSFRTPYPPYANSGTSQPKVDGRLDYELAEGARLSVAGGYAGTEGVIGSGLGPFDITSGSGLAYGSARYTKGNRRIGFFTNLLNGEAINLLTVGADGERIRLGFDTRTFDVEYSDAVPLAGRHLLSYGGNYRHNGFDITLAPDGGPRNEGGGYVQDEIFLNKVFRWVVGGRLDKFSSISDAVFSPRTTFMVKPAPTHTIRLSFNRAFRAPSYINNNMNTAILNQLDLGAITPQLAGVSYAFPIAARGNRDLRQETMTALELGYTGMVGGRATLSAALYRNTTKDAIFFTPVGRYTAGNPPPRWPLSPLVLEGLAAAGSPLPSAFSYRNLGTVRDKGLELGVDAVASRAVTVFANYSYQWQPQVEGFPLSEANLPPKHRFNAGGSITHGRYLGNLAVNYTSEAFWQDVLDARFAGTTAAYTTVNGAVGATWAGGRVTTSLKVNNLANRPVMPHVFGDVVKRQVLGEVRVVF